LWFQFSMKSFIYNKRKFFTHFLGWFGYLVFWFLQYNTGLASLDEVLKLIFIQLLFHVIAVYINNLYLIPKFLYKQKFALFFIAYIILIIAIGTTHYYLNIRLFNDLEKYFYEYRNTYEGISVTVLMGIFVTTIPAWFKVNSDKLKSDNDAKQLRNDKIEDELKFLKAQINPHFLFNSLNTVFNLIDSNTEVAKNTLVQFSEILRFQLYEASNNTINLQKEIEYIKSYAAIEKIRKGDILNVEIIEKITTLVEVPPLLLLTFVENAFKHVSNLEKGNYITIEMVTIKNDFHFKIKNSTDQFQHSHIDNKNSGIGLKNIKRRLNLLYPNKHDLKITNADNSFNVHLKIQINEF
jgi:two-component system, LytTR family, sensor kinase